MCPPSLWKVCMVYPEDFWAVTSPPYFQPDGNNHKKISFNDSPPYTDLLQYNYTGKDA